jgi:hypothetical protein
MPSSYSDSHHRLSSLDSDEDGYMTPNNGDSMDVELTGMRPFRDEHDDDDDDEESYEDAMDDLDAEFGARPTPKRITTGRCRGWCLKLLVIATVMVVLGRALKSNQNEKKNNLTALDATIDQNLDDDNPVTNEHEKEIEEAEEALDAEEKEEEHGVAPPPSSNDGGDDTPYSLGTDHTFFELHTGSPRVDAAYKLAMSELEQNVATVDETTQQPTDPYFIAGNGWTQLWTRDTSFAIELGAGLVRPDVSLTSLRKCTAKAGIRQEPKEGSHTTVFVNEKVWYQDECGHFGGWPNLSDAIVGARGAWSLYLYTGNHTLLEWAYHTTVSSIKRAEQDVKKHGLFHGCSSFMESNSGYPAKYALNGTLVGKTKALSTNLLYWNGYKLAAEMGDILMMDSEYVGHLRNQADKLKQSIRETFWNEKLGYYVYLQDEYNEQVEQMEGLGEALVLLSEEFEDSGHRIRSILDHTYRTEIGIPCLWPRFDHGDAPDLDDDRHISMRYHNGRIWPFVSGYFAIAAARKGRTDIFTEEWTRLIDLSEQQNTFAEFYELDKSFPSKRSRQLWSDTGYLGMIYQGLFGMVFEVNGIVFAPTKPMLWPYGFDDMNQKISLTNVKYRNAILDIHVTGWGNKVASFKINGEFKKLPELAATATGKQVIEIEVTDV